jgi:hypothetical protein
MKWRQVHSEEIAAIAKDKTVARGTLSEDASPKHVVYSLLFSDGTELRSKHTATPDGIMNQYEIGEP